MQLVDQQLSSPKITAGSRSAFLLTNLRKQPMGKLNKFLLAGGIISALISIFHIILALKPALYQFVAPDQNSPLSQMAQQGSSITTIASMVLVAIFASWAVVAFSGAGLLRRLPLVNTGLVIIAAIYLLRSLFLPSEISMVQSQGYPIRFVFFSALSFFTGLLYLLGFFIQKRQFSIIQNHE
jgi:hypothetical protein